MRNLFICCLLSALVWLSQRGPATPYEHMAYLGFLIVLSVLATQFAARVGLPGHIGALAIGLLAGASGPISGSAIDAAQPFSDLAAAWVGLHLGGALSPSVIFNRRFLYAATAALAGATVITATSLLVLLHLPPAYAIQLGLLSSLSAPLFTSVSQPHRREALSLALLITALGLLLFGIFRAAYAQTLPAFPPQQIFLSLVFWGIGIELVYRSASRIRTEPSRYLLFSAVALLLFLTSRSQQISPLFLSLVSGLALSLRCGRNRALLRPLGILSGLVAPLVLADFASRADVAGALRLPASSWYFLLIYAISMGVGKALGGALGSRLTGSPFRDWSQILPQGILAGLLLPLALLPRTFLAQASPLPGAVAAGFLSICGIALPLLIGPICALVERIEIGRIQVASRR